MIPFIETFRMAYDSLLRHKTRALLTMLGIVIGVGAVVAMVSVGQGATASVESQIASLGVNVLMLFPGAAFQGGVSQGAGSRASLTEEDMEAIKEDAPAVDKISPMTRANCQIIAGNLNWNTSVQGGNTEFFAIRDWKVESGEFFTEQDNRSGAKVCLLGKTVSDYLFPNQNPIGQIVRINKLPFEVIGTLAAKGQNAMGMDQDDIVLAPFSTVQKKIKRDEYVSAFIMSAKNKDMISTAKSQVTAVLRDRHRIKDGEENDFTIRTQTDIATAATSTSKIMTTLLASIASVSLLVGGIGIMNIMLVSVTERTREIGLRMSIGARRKDILKQFLIEAILLSIIGGIVGIGFGLLASRTIAKLANWPVLVSLYSVFMAFLFSAAVGMFFGYYPAKKASRLSPIEALRYE
jgi:putative ABC transport system permease protein